MILGSIYFNLRVSLQVWELIGVGAEQNHGRCSSQMQKDALKSCQSGRFEFNILNYWYLLIIYWLLIIYNIYWVYIFDIYWLFDSSQIYCYTRRCNRHVSWQRLAFGPIVRYIPLSPKLIGRCRWGMSGQFMAVTGTGWTTTEWLGTV